VTRKASPTCDIGGYQLSSLDAGFCLYRKWLTHGQMVCIANAGNFRFLSASSKSDAMRLGAGGCHVEVPHWNCRVVLKTLLSSAALARVRLGIGPLRVARFAVASVLSLGGLHHVRAFARHGHIRMALGNPLTLWSQLEPFMSQRIGLLTLPWPAAGYRLASGNRRPEKRRSARRWLREYVFRTLQYG
jgi:hypothetical protein